MTGAGEHRGGTGPGLDVRRELARAAAQEAQPQANGLAVHALRCELERPIARHGPALGRPDGPVRPETREGGVLLVAEELAEPRQELLQPLVPLAGPQRHPAPRWWRIAGAHRPTP